MDRLTATAPPTPTGKRSPAYAALPTPATEVTNTPVASLLSPVAPVSPTAAMSSAAFPSPASGFLASICR
jgi:hypothetical protein